MRVVLADLKSNRGFVSKDTVVGGYGSRLDPFSRVTAAAAYIKKQFHDVPSVHMAYLAAILARAGHEVLWTRSELVDGDVALVLSSLVDHKNETAWADAMRARGVKVGFIGITASKMPGLFADHSDFILNGEPEAGVMRIAQGVIPTGVTISEEIQDLDSLPFPRWDLITEDRSRRFGIQWSSRPVGGGFPLLDRLYTAGFRAMSFGVESLDPATLKKSGRRPIPQEHQRRIIDHCRKLGIVTAGFYVLGFMQDTWASIAATIDYSIDLGSTFAQFKILTRYPGTPMFKQLEPLLTETDWEKFDGYSPTFKHPNLTAHELKYLLGSSYKRFYMRPSYLANFLKIQNASVREWVTRMDTRVKERHAREEIADVARSIAC